MACGGPAKQSFGFSVCGKQRLDPQFIGCYVLGGAKGCDDGEHRHALAMGALRAAIWIKGKKPGLYSMKDVLGL